MPAPRDRRRSFWLVCYEDGRALAPSAFDARDVPAAWRRAERDARGRSFALYNPDHRRVRVGVVPPAPVAAAATAAAIALSPDGRLLVSGHDHGLLRALDTATGTVLWERAVGASRVDCVLMPQRAAWMVVCTRAGEIWVIERERGETILHLADDDARAIALAPDDRTLAVAGTVVDLWSLPQGVRVASLDGDIAGALHAARSQAIDDGGDPPDDDGVYAVGFACAGPHVVGVRARNGGEVVVWDRATGKRVATRPGWPVSRIALTADGVHALLGMRDDAALVQHMTLPALELRAAYATGADGLWDLRVTPDDRFALAHDDETGVYVVDLSSGATHAWLDEFEGCAYAVRRSSAGGDRARKACDPWTEPDDTRVVPLPRWRRGDPGAPLSADGRRYAALRRGHDEDLVAVFDLRTCVPYAALAHSHAVQSVWLSADGSRAATRDAQGQVFVWPLPDAPERLA